MKLRIRVKTGSPESMVEKRADGSFVVFVKSRAEKGRANKEVVKLLAEHFHRPQSFFRITRGKLQSNKTVEAQ